MNNKYTSLELSKKLHEAGFKGESEYVWRKFTMGYKFGTALDDVTSNVEKIPSYDILNDLCVKYAKELFGEYKKDLGDSDCESVGANGFHQATNVIFHLMRGGFKQDAEQYIIDNCILFKK